MLHYWSDDSFNQFKNQFNFTNLMFLEDKAENDGGGGDIKKIVWQKMLHGKTVVGNLESFITVAKSKYPDFIIEEFKTAEICEKTKH